MLFPAHFSVGSCGFIIHPSFILFIAMVTYGVGTPFKVSTAQNWRRRGRREGELRSVNTIFYLSNKKKHFPMSFFNKIEKNSSPQFFWGRAAYIHEIRVMRSFLYNYLFCHFSNGLKSGMHNCIVLHVLYSFPYIT